MMDTPSQKITYDATVIVPNGYFSRMSANTTSSEAYNETHTVTAFDASIKIPSYLIAIVIGDLVEVPLDDRVSVISEPVYIDAAVEEFAELPEFLNVVEDYLSPYVWGTYSIVIMPKRCVILTLIVCCFWLLFPALLTHFSFSFPWGGMEHPLITFAR